MCEPADELREQGSQEEALKAGYHRRDCQFSTVHNATSEPFRIANESPLDTGFIQLGCEPVTSRKASRCRRTGPNRIAELPTDGTRKFASEVVLISGDDVMIATGKTRRPGLFARYQKRQSCSPRSPCCVGGHNWYRETCSRSRSSSQSVLTEAGKVRTRSIAGRSPGGGFEVFAVATR
ncbi:MAG: hypothetical protein FWD57_09020 [Polyangiaceae bacterium]|nr:hypothetical protein [Polyangiaceae bacterium]